MIVRVDEYIMMDENFSKRKRQFEEQEERIKAGMTKIRYKIIILSGKGGVGKSTVTANLATAFAQKYKDKKVGILDADITGPSIPKMLKARKETVRSSPLGILPATGHLGIKLISMDYMLASDETPVIWRGPLKMGAIKQFLGEIEWGDLDYLIIDSPPGTGDEPLSVCQLIPEADGSIIVTTPQDVAIIDSRKTVRFSQQLKIPVVGIIENMSGFKCPHCDKSIDLFKIGGGQKAALSLNVPFLGGIPIDTKIVETSDDGKAFIYDFANATAGKAMQEIVNKIIEKTSGGKKA